MDGYYVLVRDDGLFALPPGQDKSYTNNLAEAWVFAGREPAERNACPGNERAVPLASVLRGLNKG